MTTVVLAQAHLTNNSPITVELIKHKPDAAPVVVVTWPSHKTQVSPAAFGHVMSSACRALTNASTELARRHIVPERP